MATIDQLFTALRNADAAGDTEAASRFAQMIKEQGGGSVESISDEGVASTFVRGQKPQIQTQIVTEKETPSFFSKLAGVPSAVMEAFTGEERSTPEIQSASHWSALPEFSLIGGHALDSLKTAIGTLATTPEETAQILKSNYPNLEVQQDDKGNYWFKSSINGQWYADKPGFQPYDVARLAGVAAEQALLGKGLGLIKPIATLAKGGKFARAALAGVEGAAGQTAFEGQEKATGGQFNAEQIPIAGAFGSASQPVMEAAGKVIPAIAKRVGEGGSQRATEAMRNAQRFGVEPRTSDIFPPQSQIGHRLKNIREGSILGSAGQGANVAAQREKAVNTLADYFGAGGDIPVDALEGVASDLISTQKAFVDKYQSLKRSVFERLADKGAPAMTKTERKIDEIISEIKWDEANVGIVAELESLKRRFKQARTIKDADTIRKGIGDAFQGENLSNVKTNARDAEKQLYGPVKDDFEKFIRDNGSNREVNKWKIADRELHDGIEELKVDAFRKALAKGELTIGEIKSFLINNDQKVIQLLNRRLSSEGRKMAKIAIIQEAIFDRKKITDDVIQASKVKSNLDKLGKPIRVFFSKDDVDFVKGFQNMMDLTRTAPEAKVDFTTGKANLIPQFFAGIVGLTGGVPEAVAASIGVGLMARLYESKAVRNAFVGLSEIKNAPYLKAQKAMNDLNRVLEESGFADAIRKAAVTGATTAQKEESEK